MGRHQQHLFGRRVVSVCLSFMLFREESGVLQSERCRDLVAQLAMMLFSRPALLIGQLALFVARIHWTRSKWQSLQPTCCRLLFTLPQSLVCIFLGVRMPWIDLASAWCRPEPTIKHPCARQVSSRLQT